MKRSLFWLIIGSILACSIAGYVGARLAFFQGHGTFFFSSLTNTRERGLTFNSILSTIFAVFFVYSGFKIEGTVEKVEAAEKKINIIEKNTNDTIEFFTQLNYAMNYWTRREFEKSVDALLNLSKEIFVKNNSSRKNTCDYYLAESYYERGIIDNNIEYVAKAVQYINLAIEDNNNPFKQEIINKFEEMQEAPSH